MNKIFSAQDMKEIEIEETKCGYSLLELMNNAGNKAYKYIEQNYLNMDCKKIVILCGCGNNGGDGFVIARKLLERNIDRISVVLMQGNPRTDNASKMFDKIANKINITNLNSSENITQIIDDADIVIDCVYGIGFRIPISDNISTLFSYINNLKKVVIAIDTPSGVECNSGNCDKNALNATETLTFTALKPLFISNDNGKISQKHIVIDIGIDKPILDNKKPQYFSLQQSDLQQYIKKREQNTHKGSYGTANMFCGSYGMAGACILSAMACMKCGCGLIKVNIPKSIYNIVANNVIEAVFNPLQEVNDGKLSLTNQEKLVDNINNSTASLIGCGLGQDRNTAQCVWNMIENSQKNTIIDADGLNIIAKDMSRFSAVSTKKLQFILTPHPAEMSRLTGLTVDEIQKNRRKVALDFAKKYNVILLLKGHRTVIASPNGDVFINLTGNAGMAKGGSGDVLSGIILSFLTQGMELVISAVLGAYIHGKAGDICSTKFGEYSMLARNIIDELPTVLKNIN